MNRRNYLHSAVMLFTALPWAFAGQARANVFDMPAGQTSFHLYP